MTESAFFAALVCMHQRWFALSYAGLYHRFSLMTRWFVLVCPFLYISITSYYSPRILFDYI